MNRREFLRESGTIGLLAAGCSTALGRHFEEKQAMPDYRSTRARLLTESTPAADGFHMPAEWAPHEFCLMAMPPVDDGPESRRERREIRQQWADVANALSDYEPVVMVVHPQEVAAARRILSREIEILEIPVDDGWTRDTGPVVLVNQAGERRVAGFTFNGWGGKQQMQDDALLKARLCAELDWPLYPVDLVLEGGAIAVDGQGTVLTTEQCLLNPNRNTAGDRQQLEQLLHESLGTSQVIWLGKGLEPDPITDGHIDGIAAFVEPGVVLLHTTDDRNDPNFAICRDAKRRLQESVDARGRRLDVVDLPLDAEISHMNFYIGNDCVLVPVTSRRRDNERALEILTDLFSDRTVVPVNGEVLGEGGGGIHCITQQVPAVKDPNQV